MDDRIRKDADQLSRDPDHLGNDRIWLNFEKKSVIGFGSSFFTNDLIYLDESSITSLFKTSEDFISYLKKFMHKNEMKKRVQSSNFFGRMLVPF